ncbi:hypothetical protein [Vibrio penaeicida]|uniref:hypothetical protein n=1 Tax=Vibrio penaeicida TaxID=104609 RepID=UPI0011AB4A6A|nr:hypothetical protein [Vibrio penaeicida]
MQKIIKYTLEFNSAFKHLKGFSITDLDGGEAKKLKEFAESVVQNTLNANVKSYEPEINKLYERILGSNGMARPVTEWDNTQLQTTYRFHAIRYWLREAGYSWIKIPEMKGEERREWYEPNWVQYEDGCVTITDVLGAVEYVLTEVLKGEMGLWSDGDLTSPPLTSEELKQLTFKSGDGKKRIFTRLLQGLTLALITTMYKVALDEKLITKEDDVAKKTRTILTEAIAHLEDGSKGGTRGVAYDILNGISQPEFFKRCLVLVKVLWKVLVGEENYRQEMGMVLSGQISLITLLDREYYRTVIIRRVQEQQLIGRTTRREPVGPRPVFFIGRVPIDSIMLQLYLDGNST